MQNRSESLYPIDWINKAKKDYARIKHRLKEGDIEDAATDLIKIIKKQVVY